MVTTVWELNADKNVFTIFPIKQKSDKAAFENYYHNYLKKWKKIDHPASFSIESIDVTLRSKQGAKFISILLILKDTKNFYSALDRFISLTPLEKIFCLIQTTDLTKTISKNKLSSKIWSLENLYIHSSGMCRWLPLSLHQWVIQNDREFLFQGIAKLIMDFFELKAPTELFEWKKLENKKTLPSEWVAWLKGELEEYNGIEASDMGRIFKFTFLQSWIYTMAFRFAMKDNTICAAEFEDLKSLRTFLGIGEKQAASIETLTQKSENSWHDLVFAFKGSLLESRQNKLIENNRQRAETKSSIRFHPNRACEKPNEHFGRKDIVYHAYARLETDDIQSFAIIGGEKEGKTSLLNYIMQPTIIKEYLGDKASKYHFLCLDISEGEIHNPETFFKQFYDSFKALSEMDDVIRTENRDLFNPWDVLPPILQHLKENELKLVVILDNFHLIILNTKFPNQFFEGLRSWFSTNHELACVLSSPIPLLNLAAPLELLSSPFFNIFDSYTLYPLSHREATDLLEAGIPNDMVNKSEFIEKLIDNFGCSPYPLHLAGNILIQAYKDNDISINKVIEDTYQACSGYYENIYSSLTDKQLKNIMHILNPMEKSKLPIDNTLIDRRWIKKEGKKVEIPIIQLERFFRERIGENKNRLLKKWHQFFIRTKY